VFDSSKGQCIHILALKTESTFCCISPPSQLGRPSILSTQENAHHIKCSVPRSWNVKRWSVCKKTFVSCEMIRRVILGQSRQGKRAFCASNIPPLIMAHLASASYLSWFEYSQRMVLSWSCAISCSSFALFDRHHCIKANLPVLIEQRPNRWKSCAKTPYGLPLFGRY
jgi:hypothetical protein